MKSLKKQLTHSTKQCTKKLHQHFSWLQKNISHPKKMRDTALFWSKKHQRVLLLIAIIFAGAFFRLNDFSDLARFNADQVRDAKVVDEMFSGDFPLLGPKAGGTTFHLGPACCYVEYFSSLIFGNTPDGSVLLIPLLSVASIGLFFVFFRSYFSPALTLGLTLLYAISFYNIRYSRFGWNPNLIPFFLLAFLILLQQILLLSHKKSLFWYYALLGMVMGIGMQLHTTLFLLMPILFVLVHSFLYYKHKLFSWRPILLTMAIILLAHIPFFLSDIQNNGENIASFFTGAEKKTEKNISLKHNLLMDAKFFWQGNTYALTGIEPQKSWLSPIKLFKSQNLEEISLFLLGSGFFLFGSYLAVIRLRLAKKSLNQKQYFLWLMLATSGLLFLLFFPIAEELSLRFFIVIFFLPFLFLGLCVEYLLGILKEHSHLKMVLIGTLFILLIVSNGYRYVQVYNLDNYTERESAYGGISLGEAKRIAESIIHTHQTSPDAELFLAPFAFKRSIEYLTAKEKLKLAKFSPKKVSENSRVFVIVLNTAREKRLAEYECCYTILKEDRFGRFTLLTLAPEQKQCKIGIITDIHSTYSKSGPYRIGLDSYTSLKSFAKEMNQNFQPDAVVEIGDFIDGSETSNARALETYQETQSLIDTIKNAPVLHVMGNHETRGGGITTEQWLEFAKQSETYSSTILCGGTQIITLDGNNAEIRKEQEEELKYSYFIDARQREWLENTLEHSPTTRKIVFIHEPLFPRAEISSSISPEKDMRQADVKMLNDLFAKYDVEIVFSGHVETLFRRTIDTTDHIILPGVRKSKNLPIEWLGTFAELTITPSASPKLTLFYRKKTDPVSRYRKVIIPSKEFDALEK